MNCFDCIFYGIFYYRLYRRTDLSDSNFLTGFMISLFLAAPDPRLRRVRNLTRTSVQNGIRFFLLFGKKYCFIQKLSFLIDRFFGNVFQTPMLKHVFQLLEKGCFFFYFYLFYLKLSLLSIYTKLKSNLHQTTKIFTIKIKI